MTNWYKTSQTTQATATDDTARTERINAVSTTLTQETFPKFVNEVGFAIQDSINNVAMEKVETYANQIPQFLQLTSYNIEAMKVILRSMAARAAQIALQNSLKNTKQDAWILLQQDPAFINNCITEFFKSVYTPSQEELESLKLTMQKK